MQNLFLTKRRNLKHILIIIICSIFVISFYPNSSLCGVAVTYGGGYYPGSLSFANQDLWNGDTNFYGWENGSLGSHFSIDYDFSDWIVGIAHAWSGSDERWLEFSIGGKPDPNKYDFIQFALVSTGTPYEWELFEGDSYFENDPFGSYLVGVKPKDGYQWDSFIFTLIFKEVLPSDPAGIGTSTVIGIPYVIEVSEPAPVPIPGTVWLLGSGIFCLVGFRRKFQK